jgi:PhnB protein
MATSDPSVLRPRLVVDGAARAIDYYKDVFAAEEIERYEAANGKIVHAELAIGNGRFTLKDADDTDGAPASFGGSPVLLMLDVDDVDAVAERMVAAGGKVIFAIADSDHGRGGRVQDAFGHVWMISQQSAAPR